MPIVQVTAPAEPVQFGDVGVRFWAVAAPLSTCSVSDCVDAETYWGFRPTSLAAALAGTVMTISACASALGVAPRGRELTAEPAPPPQALVENATHASTIALLR